jgi:hypothetical protein
LHIKKSLLVLGAVTGIGLAGITGLGVASAATDTASGASNIIDKLSARFNLDKDDVKVVFEEERAEREAEQQQRTQDRLDQAVKDGKLTEEQKAKILAKLEELRVKREEWKNVAPEGRSGAKMELHQSLEQWAKDNNIPMHYLMGMYFHKVHGGAEGIKAVGSSTVDSGSMVMPVPANE